MSKSQLVKAWPEPRRVDIRDDQIRVDSLPVAAWNAVARRFICSDPARAGLSQRRLAALLDQTVELPPDEIALVVEVNLGQLVSGVIEI